MQIPLRRGRCASRPCDLLGKPVELKIAYSNARRMTNRPATEQRFNTNEKLRQRKWLRQVVIRASIGVRDAHALQLGEARLQVCLYVEIERVHIDYAE
jgi:hypothetical protein